MRAQRVKVWLKNMNGFRFTWTHVVLRAQRNNNQSVQFDPDNHWRWPTLLRDGVSQSVHVMPLSSFFLKPILGPVNIWILFALFLICCQFMHCPWTFYNARRRMSAYCLNDISNLSLFTWTGKVNGRRSVCLSAVCSDGRYSPSQSVIYTYNMIGYAPSAKKWLSLWRF